MSRWPATSWAMCGGIPCMIASVMSILRKSWGANLSGWPAASVSPVWARAMSSSCRMAWAVTGPVLCAQAALEQQRHRRVPLALVVVIGNDQGHAVLVAPDPGDDGAEHVGQLR